MSNPSRHLKANLAALAAADKQPAVDVDTSTGRVRVEPGVGADLDIRIANASDQWVRVQPAHAPRAEADTWVAALPPEPAGHTVFVIGVGSGHVLHALEARYPSIHVVVVEPDPALARALLTRRDWQPWITSGRLHLFVGPRYEGTAGAWALYDSDDQPSIIVNPVLAREWPADVKAASEVVRQITFGAQANRHARRQNAGTYLLNTLRQLPWLVHTGDVAALVGTARGIPAIVAAAGPSLEANTAIAPDAFAGKIVICADTALRPLLRRRVTPTFVVALDPTVTNAGHFQGLGGIDDVWLVGEGSLAPGVFQQFAGRTFAFEVSGHQPWKWLQHAEFFRGRLRAWGSVLTSAYDLAVMLGCDPIIFIGADLAFSGSQPYTRGTTYEEAWAGSIVGGIDLPSRWTYDLAKRPLVPEPDVRGNKASTTSILRTFRDWILADLRQGRGGRVLNATGAGILHGAEMTQVSASDIGDIGTSVSPGEIVERVRAAYRPDPDAWRRVRALANDVLEHGDGAEGAPLTAWDQFVLGSVDREVVNDVLRDAIERLGDAPPDGPAPEATVVAAELIERALQSPLFDGLFHPERIALIAASLAGVPAPAWVASARLASEHADRVRWLELAAAGQLVLQHESDVLASPGLPESPPAMGVEGTPASAIADWRPATRRLVWAIEMMIAQVLRSSPAPSALSEWILAPTFPVADEDGAARRVLIDEPGRARESFARAQLLRESMLALSAAHPGDVHFARAAGVSAVMARTAAQHLEATPTRPPDARARVAIVPGGGAPAMGVSMGIQSRDLARAFTGWATKWPVESSVEPRVVSQAPFGDCLSIVELEPSPTAEPRSSREILLAREGSIHLGQLISPDGALFNHVAVLDSSSAIATGFGTPHSVRIDEEGTATALFEWPYPIDGEVPWGEGGSLSWTGSWTRPDETDALLQWRNAAGTAALNERVPFVPRRAVVANAATVYWPSITGGLWEWYPGRGGRQLVAGLPLVDAFTDGTDVCLEAVDPKAGLFQPPGLRNLRLSSGKVVDSYPPGPLGSAWGRAERDGVTAIAYAHADCVIVTNATGASLALVAYYPVGVAWAGRSLLVLSATGHLLLFEGLSSR